MEPEHIALIETGGSHDECLYSQVLFLKKYGYHVHIIIFEDHFNRIEKWKEVDNWQTYSKPDGRIGEWKLVFRILKYLRSSNIRKAIINTAEGNIIRKLAMVPSGSIEFSGLIHLSRKLWTSGSQKIISRKIKKYFVLADFISENLDKSDSNLMIEYFYPIFFPTSESTESKKQDGDFLVCIPGAVDYARRDYDSLMKEIVLSGVPSGIKFILLGRTSSEDGRNLISRIREEGLEEHFTIYDSFIDYPLFYKEISSSQLILPLISPGSHYYEDYLKYQITGTYNLAWGFHIPMLMHDSFKSYRIFRQTSVFYRNGEMMQALETLAGRKDKLKSIQKNISELSEFDFDKQAERYVNFIRR